MHHKHNLHEALLILRARGPRYPTSGICSNLEYLLDGIFEEKDIPDDALAAVSELMTSVACDWPKHSGSNMFPIPNPDWDPAECEPHDYRDAANTAYACRRAQAWDRTKPYGALRYELLDFLIERTKP